MLLKGEAWIDFLADNNTHESNITWQGYGEQLYAPAATVDIDLNQLHQQACNWACHFYRNNKKSNRKL